VLAWYRGHGRPLNFRTRRDPYAVLVSEVMAQQTQIARVEPAWAAFLAAFPTIESLAGAPVVDVLRAWRGLGYNRRALNLRRAAQVVVTRHGGVVPEDVAALRELPGVGPYTARAVAAIAFGRPEAPVDTNVRRVLGRVRAGWAGLPGPELQAVADELVPAGRAGEWTHALMDIGAVFCRPRSPRCETCPVRPWCVAAATPAAPAADPAEPATADPVTPAAAATGDRAEAASARRGTAPRESRVSFASTSRWLRGRLVDRARSAPGDGWIRVDEPIEPHGVPAVAIAAAALAGDGLLEFDPADSSLARIPR
jgi:A/G-specific adenine glycosylase